MSTARVAIILGSDSDWAAMEGCREQLRELQIPVDVEVISAHRTPDRLRDYVRQAEAAGVGVFIAGAGMAAALPGAVASFTTRPVIGVPLDASALQGLDSLLSIVQMPPGVPVATVAIGKAGARNAAILAAQMLALADAALAERLKILKSDQAAAVDKKSQALRERLAHG
jgi:phosphoribosylaminoimidazole carboxylase PurE protein